MKARREGTSSPISMEKMPSATAASAMLDLEQVTCLRVHRRFEELLRIHFSETFVSLDTQAAATDVRMFSMSSMMEFSSMMFSFFSSPLFSIKW